MKKRRIRLLTIIFTSMFLFSGCGTPLYEITEEEENVIVHYAAYALARHNVYQKDGMTTAVPVEEDDVSAEESSEEEPQEIESESEENNVVDIPDESSDGEDIDPGDIAGTLSLGETIGSPKGITVSYKGFDVAGSYQEGGYYSIDAKSGKKFVVMNFAIKNTSSKKVKVDALKHNLSFAASFDGGESIRAEQTFLTYSLSTIQDKIKPGKKVNVVLLFQVDSKKANGISDVKLTVRKNKNNYSVKL